ncbi:hypothetical protein CERSUDRAFT_82291 [Gelatoporia subvermispora B]|uniref:Uncharacterized protein n=1 Tax=Ceriporiopsis subvermispora (strain B) TaxID=914234 RepID=M2R0M4_CERS8|nr:hypothetical protein CERSUDRAFT_82291 [Gelatoporia subvermispora B]
MEQIEFEVTGLAPYMCDSSRSPLKGCRKVIADHLGMRSTRKLTPLRIVDVTVTLHIRISCPT